MRRCASPVARRGKSLAAAALVTTAALALAACGSGGSGKSGGGGSAGAAPGRGHLRSIYFANPLPSNPAMIAIDRCFKTETKRLGIEGTSSGPSGNAVNKQYTLDGISQAIALKVGGIMLMPLTPDFTPLMQRAKAQGIYTAALNTGSTTSAQSLEVGTDYATMGAAVGKAIGERPGQQNVGIVTNGPGGVGDALIKSLKSHLPPNVKVVAEVFDGGDPAKTADVVLPMMAAHPEINVLWSWQSTAVGGMMTAIKERNAVGKVVAVNGDLTPQNIAGIRSGVMYGSLIQNWCTMATRAVDLLVQASDGKSVPAATDTGTEFVTKQNLDAVIRQQKATGQIQ